MKDWETEPVFKSGVDHCVDWWQRTRGDPIPGFKFWIGSHLHMSVIMYRYSQVIEYKVSYIFKKDKVGDKKS